MELLIKDRLKEHRKRKKLTQEALAEVLGISPQSISKWECGDGYPDITLLPSIANYFGITVDELIGNDEISARGDIEDNFFGVLHLLTDDEGLDLALRYHKKYPRDWHIATTLMHMITRDHRDKLDEYRQYLYTLCKRLLEECTDSVLRSDAVRSVCMICEEEKIEYWLSRDTAFFNDDKHEIYEERYRLEGDVVQCLMYKHAGNFLAVLKGLWKIACSRNYRDNPDEAILWNESYIRLLDAASASDDADVISDGWLSEYAFAHMRLAAAYFGRGDREKGYKQLEKAVTLAERFDSIPNGAPLRLGNEHFYGDTMAIKGHDRLILPNGKSVAFSFGITGVLPNFKSIMEPKVGWEWFDSVRGDVRFEAYLERARRLS